MRPADYLRPRRFRHLHGAPEGGGMSVETLEIQAVPTDESLNIQALMDEALRLWAADQQSALALGKALIAVRDALRNEHGAFTSWFREAGLVENRVYYCI